MKISNRSDGFCTNAEVPRQTIKGGVVDLIGRFSARLTAGKFIQVINCLRVTWNAFVTAFELRDFSISIEWLHNMVMVFII